MIDNFVKSMIEYDILYVDMLLIIGYSWEEVDDILEYDMNKYKEKAELKKYMANLERETQRNITEVMLSMDADWVKKTRLNYLNSQIELKKGNLNSKYREYQDWVKYKKYEARKEFTITGISNNIKSLETQRDVAENPDSNRITQVDINTAKNRGFAEILNLNNAGFTCCPFHEEDTPSFKVYNKVRAYCFGCHWTGDRIDAEMKIHGIDFIQAVKKLKEGL